MWSILDWVGCVGSHLGAANRRVHSSRCSTPVVLSGCLKPVLATLACLALLGCDSGSEGEAESFDLASFEVACFAQCESVLTELAKTAGEWHESELARRDERLSALAGALSPLMNAPDVPFLGSMARGESPVGLVDYEAALRPWAPEVRRVVDLRGPAEGSQVDVAARLGFATGASLLGPLLVAETQVQAQAGREDLARQAADALVFHAVDLMSTGRWSDYAYGLQAIAPRLELHSWSGARELHGALEVMNIPGASELFLLSRVRFYRDFLPALARDSGEVPEWDGTDISGQLFNAGVRGQTSASEIAEQLLAASSELDAVLITLLAREAQAPREVAAGFRRAARSVDLEEATPWLFVPPLDLVIARGVEVSVTIDLLGAAVEGWEGGDAGLSSFGGGDWNEGSVSANEIDDSGGFLLRWQPSSAWRGVGARDASLVWRALRPAGERD